MIPENLRNDVEILFPKSHCGKSKWKYLLYLLILYNNI